MARENRLDPFRDTWAEPGGLPATGPHDGDSPGRYDYLLPTALHDELTLATWRVASGGNLTPERRFQLMRNPDQAMILCERWELVCIALGTEQARSMPAEFVRRICRN